MNKRRRKRIEKMALKVQMLISECDSIIDEENDSRSNIPENLQCSRRFDQSEEYCDELYEISSSLNEISIIFDRIRDIE